MAPALNKGLAGSPASRSHKPIKQKNKPTPTPPTPSLKAAFWAFFLWLARAHPLLYTRIHFKGQRVKRSYYTQALGCPAPALGAQRALSSKHQI
ncbi:hypothetical protein CHS0354_027245 [Potamilus streckersoni]|uniref:Uncharacterized protein n=1 Tax=Potamilus streckersoni TaxID=2493646 RepID=A0AAE0RYC2_9BIVA|nr:hypothetical protein CHS0354_027245 [Potamilus streckersoni]